MNHGRNFDSTRISDIVKYSHKNFSINPWKNTISFLLSAILMSCGSVERNILTSGIGMGMRTPSTEIEQIYYLGSFDPQGQLPPTLYRVRLHGQASILNFTRFASGWMPSNVVDTLSGNITTSEANATITSNGASTSFKTGRRLVQFGPEGFREAPANHRLVVVMGSDPSEFFQAMGAALGEVSGANMDIQRLELNSLLVNELSELRPTLAMAELELMNVQSLKPD